MIRVLAKANKKAEILIHEQIGGDWFGDGLTSKRFAQQLKDLGEVDSIKVRINSPGGAVSDGVAIYNALKTHGAQINVVVEGLAASIASIIAMAGDTISMGEGSLMMIHSPWTFAMGSADDMRETADVLDKFESSLVDIYASKTGLSRDELSSLLKAETWLNGEEAVRMGFATEASDGGDAEAAALIQNDHREAFKRFANEFRQPADVTPQRIAAALFPSAQADSKETEMTDEEKRAAEAAQKKAINDAVQAALAANRERQQQIRNAFAPFAEHHAELMNECLLDEQCTAKDASDKLLKAVAKVQDETGSISRGIALIADSKDKFFAGAQNAILARIGREKLEPGNQYAGRSLVDLAEISLRHAGVSTAGMTKDGIARKVLALSTSDFPQLLSSTAGKVLRAAFEARPTTWRAWAAKGQVSDFKVHPRIQMGSFSSLATIAENAEYTYGGVGEYYENAQAVTKGKAILFTRPMLVNDDLGGFNRRAMLMGDAAARTVNEDAYASLLSASGLGPTSSDTGTLFNATAVTTAGGHANYTSSGTAISVTSMGVGRVAMAKQKAGNLGTGATLNIVPAVLLTSINKEDIARTFMASETDPASSNSRVPNIYRNRYEVVADPLIDAATYTNSWYLFADPNGPAAAMEVVFLDGNETPFIDDEVDFDTDALKFKVRLDYGIALGDWRGAYRNLGA